jgi:hypothetical protein
MIGRFETDPSIGDAFFIACMVLQNFIREHNSEDADFARFDRDPNYMPTIPERYKRDVVLANASDTFRDELTTSLTLGWH